MAMTIDAGHQALDLNVGRILELFLDSEITLDKAKIDLTKFFDQPKRSRGASDLDDYLTLVLGQARTRELEVGDVRADIVRIAAIAQSRNPDFEAHIQRGVD